ncbi:MAG: aminoglycoside phosphotransferase family protein [Egibacteraceae bacterium]
MLNGTLTPEFPPGSNIKGHVAGASWTFLLLDLDLQRTVCLGEPSSATLATVTRLSREVVLAGAPARRPGPRSDARTHGVRTVRLGHDGTIPLPDRSVDLVLAADPSWTSRLERGTRLQAEVDRVLHRHGRLYLPLRSLPATEGEDDDLLWHELANGEPRAIAPLGDLQAATFLTAAAGPAWQPRSLTGRARRALGLPGPRTASITTAAALRGSDSDLRRPPRYLVEAAAAAGVAIDGHRWALLSAGEYRTKKVLLFLFPPGDAAPEYVVKLTRHPDFNARLENEYRALSELERRGLAARSVPRAAFHGTQAGIAFVGETAVSGIPLRERTTARPDCPDALAALDWLVELGISSADRTARATDAAATLGTLLDRFVTTYRPDARHRAFLAEQIAALGRHPEPFPVVFTHGDAGTWNVLIDKAGRPLFLDWEAADPQGPPLWDMLYFFRSHAITVARRAGIRDRLRAFERGFLEASELNRLLCAAVERYCAKVGLARCMAEPLFYTCWMHRSLKEAKTLSERTLHRGRYVRLLIRCIDQQKAPGLVSLFSRTGCN